MAGGLLANVNRWRAQVGLGPTTDEQLPKTRSNWTWPAPRAVLRPGRPEGRSHPGRGRAQGGQTWFLKMKGPAELVGRQQANFEAFAKSVRFE